MCFGAACYFGNCIIEWKAMRQNIFHFRHSSRSKEVLSLQWRFLIGRSWLDLTVQYNSSIVHRFVRPDLRITICHCCLMCQPVRTCMTVRTCQPVRTCMTVISDWTVSLIFMKFRTRISLNTVRCRKSVSFIKIFRMTVIRYIGASKICYP